MYPRRKDGPVYPILSLLTWAYYIRTTQAEATRYSHRRRHTKVRLLKADVTLLYECAA